MTLTFDLVTQDPSTDEFAVYLVEEGPWPSEKLKGQLKKIQSRLYDALDAVIDGHLAEHFPQSKGMAVRIQLDCHGEAPAEIESLVDSLDRLIHASGEEYCEAIRSSPYVSSVRVVTRKGVGRGLPGTN